MIFCSTFCRNPHHRIAIVCWRFGGGGGFEGGCRRLFSGRGGFLGGSGSCGGTCGGSRGRGTIGFLRGCGGCYIRNRICFNAAYQTATE